MLTEAHLSFVERHSSIHVGGTVIDHKTRQIPGKGHKMPRMKNLSRFRAKTTPTDDDICDDVSKGGGCSKSKWSGVRRRISSENIYGSIVAIKKKLLFKFGEYQTANINFPLQR